MIYATTVSASDCCWFKDISRTWAYLCISAACYKVFSFSILKHVVNYMQFFLPLLPVGCCFKAYEITRSFYEVQLVWIFGNELPNTCAIRGTKKYGSFWNRFTGCFSSRHYRILYYRPTLSLVVFSTCSFLNKGSMI